MGNLVNEVISHAESYPHKKVSKSELLKNPSNLLSIFPLNSPYKIELCLINS